MNNQNVNNNNQNAGANLSVNAVALSNNAQNYNGPDSIQLCFLGSENSGKHPAQVYLLHENGHEDGIEMNTDASLDIESTNALGTFVLSMATVPTAFQSLHDVVIRESDVFIVFYNRRCRESFANARREVERVMRIKEDENPQCVFVGNSDGADMDFFNLPHWVSTGNDPVSRNEGLAFAEEFDAVYMEVQRGNCAEVSEAIAACLNLYINARVLEEEIDQVVSRMPGVFRKMWRTGVVLSRPVRYASRDAWLSTRLTLSNAFHSRTHA